jgi:hypothetical protein
MTPDDMQDQVEALNRLAREEAGALVDTEEMQSTAIEAEGPKDLPHITLPGEGRRITDFAREAAQACRLNGVYRRDSQPCIINRETGGIEPLTPAKFCTELEEVAVTSVIKVVKSGGDEFIVKKPKTMTKAVAEVALCADAFIYGLRKLERVNMVRQPVLRWDGRMELLPIGYDEESGIYTMPNAVEITSRESLLALDPAQRKSALYGAASLIRSALKEFPMVSDLDLSIQVTSMISFFGSLLLPSNAIRLNFEFKANKHRSGKTLLVKMAVVPVMGKAIVMTFPRDENKLQDLLASVSKMAKSYLILDDVKGFLSSEALNAFLTAAWWGGRNFHAQTMFEAKRQAIVYLSGHELTLSPDLAGRFLECRLHVETADSTEARVKMPIDDDYLSSLNVRSDLLSALHTIIVLWDLAGRPKGKTLRPGFEEWCRVYGGIVDFAGFGDPCARRPDDEGSDPEFDDMLALVKDLVEAFDKEDKMKEFTFAHLVERCVELKAFNWVIDGQWKVDKEANERWFQLSKRADSKLGWLFGNKYGDTVFQITDGRRVRFGNQGKNRQRRYTLTVL